MLHIAICDDQPNELSAVAAYTKDYLNSQQLDAQVLQFSHPEALLKACETARFHLYILDIVMPMINGVELAREIRRLDQQAQIIFATSEPSFALEAYAAFPLSYLLKPVDRNQLFDVLAFAVSKADLEEEISVTVKTKDGLRVLLLYTITCCEYIGRCAVYTLADGETVTSRSLQESFAEHTAPLLKDKRFLHPHKAFVINMSRVINFSKEEFILRGNVHIPISSKQYAAVRDTYMDYHLKRKTEI